MTWSCCCITNDANSQAFFTTTVMERRICTWYSSSHLMMAYQLEMSVCLSFCRPRAVSSHDNHIKIHKPSLSPTRELLFIRWKYFGKSNIQIKTPKSKNFKLKTSELKTLEFKTSEFETSETKTSEVKTIPAPTFLKIMELDTQPKMPNNTGHAWVMICQADSEPFDKCFISNQLWYLEYLPKQECIALVEYFVLTKKVKSNQKLSHFKSIQVIQA